jgi:hypothetical protein
LVRINVPTSWLLGDLITGTARVPLGRPSGFETLDDVKCPVYAAMQTDDLGDADIVR